MEQLRKIGIWCWNSKERVVLALMVLLLGWRVYTLVDPPESDDQVFDVRAPGPGPIVAPDGPLRIPSTQSPLPVTPLVRRSIFVIEKPTGRPIDPNNPENEEDSKLVLQGIVPDGFGGYKARISTGASRKLYKEGAAFESYTLRKIDADTECVEIYSENTARTFELCLE